MSPGHEIIDLGTWLESPAGRYLLAWEQARIDIEVADLFGFHAVQVGMPQLDALRANRMPHRWLCASSALVPGSHVVAESHALPFDHHSLDLVVLPHTLEWSTDPHATLAEVDRVLRPEGRVVVIGLNPASLWAARQQLGRLRPRPKAAHEHDLFLPREGEFIGYRRLRDWLRLLSFEVEGGRFGCYRPPLLTDTWLNRFEWMDNWGDRWWPVFGAVYCCVAVKRVRGMRLVGLAKKPKRANRAVAVAAAPRQGVSAAWSLSESGGEVRVEKKETLDV